MESVNFTYTRANLTAVMDKVEQERAPLMVTRQKGESVVMMSLAEYNALEETAYLLRSPKNAQRLLDAVDELIPVAGSEAPEASKKAGIATAVAKMHRFMQSHPPILGVDTKGLIQDGRD